MDAAGSPMACRCIVGLWKPAGRHGSFSNLGSPIAKADRIALCLDRHLATGAAVGVSLHVVHLGGSVYTGPS
jgi:hypothetical protein